MRSKKTKPTTQAQPWLASSSLRLTLRHDVILLTQASAGPSADILEAVPPVSIFVEKRFSSSEAWIVIYLENLDATSVTSSVNLSHSSIVL